MPADGWTTHRADFVRSKGGNSLVRTSYRPPLDGREDLHQEFDQWTAKRAFELLNAEFPGHEWRVECDCAQGMVWFRLPFMGESLCYAIRLAQWSDLQPAVILKGGAEIINRWKLPKVFEPGCYSAALALSRASPHAIPTG